MCKDKFILRLANTVIGNEAPTLSNGKSSASIILPAHLRNKGRCNVKVISAFIALQNATATRVVANGVNLIALRSNIQQLGHSNENNAYSNILAQSTIAADTTRSVSLEASDALEFTCPALPDVIEIDRVCYDHANSFNLIAAKNYTTATVPFQVTLEITFDLEHI